MSVRHAVHPERAGSRARFRSILALTLIAVLAFCALPASAFAIVVNYIPAWSFLPGGGTVHIDDGFSYNRQNTNTTNVDGSGVPRVECSSCLMRVLLRRTDGSHFGVRDGYGGASYYTGGPHYYSRALTQMLTGGYANMWAYKVRE